MIRNATRLLTKTTLQTDLKKSMQAKDKFRVTVIKSVLADMITSDKSGIAVEKRPSIGELVQRGIKKRGDSVKAYLEGSREDLAKIEQDEIVILSSLLPAQLDAAHVEKIIKEIVVENGIKAKELGKLMKILSVSDLLDPSVVSRKSVSEIAKLVLSKE